MHNPLSPNIPKYVCIKVEGRCIFMKSEICLKFVYSSIRQLYCCDITDIISTVPPERAAYKKLTRTLKIIALDWIKKKKKKKKLPKLLLLDF